MRATKKKANLCMNCVVLFLLMYVSDACFCAGDLIALTA